MGQCRKLVAGDWGFVFMHPFKGAAPLRFSSAGVHGCLYACGVVAAGTGRHDRWMLVDRPVRGFGVVLRLGNQEAFDGFKLSWCELRLDAHVEGHCAPIFGGEVRGRLGHMASTTVVAVDRRTVERRTRRRGGGVVRDGHAEADEREQQQSELEPLAVWALVFVGERTNVGKIPHIGLNIQMQAGKGASALGSETSELRRPS